MIADRAIPADRSATGDRDIRIGYIHDVAMPGPQANTVNVAKMCSAFAGLPGARVLLVHFASARGSSRIDAHYRLPNRFARWAVPLGTRFPSRFRMLAVLAALRLRLWRADVVMGRKPSMLRYAARFGMPVILELHAPITPDQRNDTRALAELVVHPALRLVVTISQALADEVAAAWPALAGRIVVAHDGADVPAHPAVPPAMQADRLTVGYAGHLYPGKGMELIAALARARPQHRFVVLGGRAGDVARWRDATQDVPNLTLAGMVPHAEVHAMLEHCDVLLAPYASRVGTSDGRTDIARWMSPLKLFEYMAAARPVMASDLPVLREVVTDGETALLCAPGDVEAWAARLDTLATDPAARARIGANARRLLEREYSWTRRAARIRAAFGAAMTGTASTSHLAAGGTGN